MLLRTNHPTLTEQRKTKTDIMRYTQCAPAEISAIVTYELLHLGYTIPSGERKIRENIFASSFFFSINLN